MIGKWLQKGDGDGDGDDDNDDDDDDDDDDDEGQAPPSSVRQDGDVQVSSLVLQNLPHELD